MSGQIPGIAGHAVRSAVHGCPERIKELFEQACSELGVSVAVGEFLDAFALEAARAIDEGRFDKYLHLFDGIRQHTSISLGQICRTFSAEGADPALLPADTHVPHHGMLSTIKGEHIARV